MKQRPSHLTLVPTPAQPSDRTYTPEQTTHAVLAALVSGESDKVLLRLPHALLHDLCVLLIERLRRRDEYRRLLFLVSASAKGTMLERWAQARELGEPVRGEARPSPHARQLCIATLTDVQTVLQADLTRAFFQEFDLLLIYEVPRPWGPAFAQILDSFAASGTRVLGLSSHLSQEEGETLFGTVITAAF